MASAHYIFPDDNEQFTFDWTVTVWVPKDGTKVPMKLPVTFKHVDPDRRLEILNTFREIQEERNQLVLSGTGEDEDGFEGTREEDGSHLTFEQDLLEEVMVGFDIVDKHKNKVEFNQHTLRKLLKFDPVRTACVTAYMRALNGRKPEKNSSRSRRRGRKT